MEKKPGLANIKNDRWKYCNLPIRVWTFWFWNLGKKVWLVINDLFDKKCISWRLQSERERKRERRLMDSQPTSVYHSQFDGWVAFVIYIQFACVCLYLCTVRIWMWVNCLHLLLLIHLFVSVVFFLFSARWIRLILSLVLDHLNIFSM